MTGEVAILNLLQQQRSETNQQFASLRESNEVIAKAVATLTTTIARVEERHSGHDVGMKRMGKQLDDHENRMRAVESKSARVAGVAAAISVVMPIILFLANKALA